MPYKNMPQSMWGRMDKCVSDVQGKGHDKQASIAICYTSLMKGKELSIAMKEFDAIQKETAETNNLPDSAFLYIEDGGKKDGEGKTVPRDLRHLPYKNSGGSIDLPRLRNALSRLGQSNTGDTGGDKWLTALLRDSLRAKAEKILSDATKKEMSLPEQVSEIESAFDEQFGNESNTPMTSSSDMEAQSNAEPYLVNEYTDYVIACALGKYYRVNFTKDDSGKITFDDLTNWVEVQPETVWQDTSKMMTLKQSNGHYRWIAFTSSSYQDNDKEIVSQKALEQDAARMNATGEYGTLDWWHTPIILGDCDTSFMHGHISIESGTFRDDRIGELFATMKGLGMSRTFFNPTNEPDANGVYHNIRTFSRAILPAERASNRLTLLDVSAKENKMSVVDKAKGLVTKLMEGGADKSEAEAKVTELLKTAEAVDLAAKEANIQQKETASVAPEAKVEQPAAPEPKAWFVGDMTPDEFDARLEKAVVKFMTPAVKEIGEQVAKMNEAQAVTAKETGDKLAASIKSTQDMQTDFAARLAALEGLKPRGYRPTEDPNTKVDKEVVTQKTPKGDTVAEHSVESWLGKHLPGLQK